MYNAPSHVGNLLYAYDFDNKLVFAINKDTNVFCGLSSIKPNRTESIV